MRINQLIARRLLMGVCAALLIFAACSSANKSPEPQTNASTTLPPSPEGTSASAYSEGVAGGVIVNTVEVTAKVIDIDYATRKVTLMGPNGDQFTTKAGPDAINFDQVQKGDLLKITMTEELVIFIDKDGASPGNSSAGVVKLNPKGAKPGGVIAETTQVTATVVNIDSAGRTVTLDFPDGSTKTFPVRDDIDLSQHNPGEKVTFRVTEMIAISVKKQ